MTMKVCEESFTNQFERILRIAYVFWLVSNDTFHAAALQRKHFIS